MNTASRSKMSIAGSVTSPWMRSGTPASAIASSVAIGFSISVTPEAEFVVAPAG